MKYKFILIGINLFFFFSCSVEDSKEMIKDIVAENASTKKITSAYDNIYEVSEGKVYELENSYGKKFDSQQKNIGVYNFENLTVSGFLPLTTIYLGSIVNAPLFDKRINKVIGFQNEKNQVNIKLSSSNEVFKVEPTMSSYRSFLRNEVKGSKLIDSKLKYSFFVKKINKLKDFDLVCGFNYGGYDFFRIPSISNIDKTTVVLDLVQEYFSSSVSEVMNGNIFKSNEILQKYLNDNPIYINSISYGKRELLVIESSTYNYDELLFAIRELNELSDPRFYSELTKNVLNAIEVRNRVGINTSQQAIGIFKLDEIIRNFKTPSSEMDLGEPIFFKAKYAATNEPFISVVNVE